VGLLFCVKKTWWLIPKISKLLSRRPETFFFSQGVLLCNWFAVNDDLGLNNVASFCLTRFFHKSL